jgi:hypothetical protein
MPLEIFAGPIVRRVTTQKVCIWLATLSLAVVEVSVLSGGKRLGASTTKSISLKDKLFIHLAEVPPDQGTFPSNQVLQYQIGVPSASGFDYTDFEDFVVDARLAYGNDRFYSVEGRSQAILAGDKPNLPTFVIPVENGRLNVAFGSCRKIHDKGPDALAELDGFLEITRDELTKRPAALFLGGDQIYADDVDVRSVLPAILDLSQKLSLIEATAVGYPYHLLSEPRPDR